MKYIIKPTSQFKKDLKKMEKQHKDLSLLTEIINNLANAVPLPEKIKTMNCQVTSKVVGNVTFNLTGF